MAGRREPRYGASQRSSSAASPCWQVTGLPVSVLILLPLFFLLTSLYLVDRVNAASKESEKCVQHARVAVIGGGISGAATATFLKKLTDAFNEGHGVDPRRCHINLHVDMFESSDRLGGRLDHVNVSGGHVEVGGESVDSANLYVNQFMNMYRAHTKEQRREEEGEDVVPATLRWSTSDYTVVYNGEPLPLLLANFDNTVAAAVDSALRGWSSLYHSLDADIPKELEEIEKFSKTPQIKLDGGTAFETGHDMAAIADVQKWLYSKFSTFLQDASLRGTSKVARASVLAVFTQTLDVHTLAGLLSLTNRKRKPATLPGPLRQIVEFLIDRFTNDLFMECRIDKIHEKVNRRPEKMHTNTFTLESNNCKSLAPEELRRREYEYVVIATPLSPALRIFRDVDGADPVELFVPYYVFQDVFVTAVQAKKIREGAPLVREMTTVVDDTSDHADHTGSFFVSTCGATMEDGQPVLVTCKLKSQRPLSDDFLNRMFEGISIVESRQWQAYPFQHPFSSTSTLESPTYPPAATKFELTSGLFYVNAFEGVFSCMEGQAVAARNVAQLLVKSIESESDGSEKHSSAGTQ